MEKCLCNNSKENVGYILMRYLPLFICMDHNTWRNTCKIIKNTNSDYVLVQGCLFLSPLTKFPVCVFTTLQIHGKIKAKYLGGSIVFRRYCWQIRHS